MAGWPTRATTGTDGRDHTGICEPPDGAHGTLPLRTAPRLEWGWDGFFGGHGRMLESELFLSTIETLVQNTDLSIFQGPLKWITPRFWDYCKSNHSIAQASLSEVRVERKHETTDER